MDFKELWKLIKKKTKKTYKKVKRWIKRYIRLLVRHTKAKDYSVLMYTIFAVIAFILVIVLFGKIFSGGGDKKKKKTTEAPTTTESTTPSDAYNSEDIAMRQLSDQCKIIYEGNKDLLMLINEVNPLADGYTFEHHTLNCGVDVDERAYNDLSDLLSACNDADNEYSIISGYRSRAEQQELIDNNVQKYMADGLTEEEAYNKTYVSVQKAGCSEHETGLAIDISGAGVSELDDYLSDDPTNQWLMQNSYKYGYILRYPQSKVEVTKIGYEPWHFRYVGKEAAAFLYNNNLTLEEFYKMLNY